MMQYEISHRPNANAASELLTVDAPSNSAAISVAHGQIPEGNTIVFVRPANDDLGS
jgi:hypothetical protein